MQRTAWHIDVSTYFAEFTRPTVDTCRIPQLPAIFSSHPICLPNIILVVGRLSMECRLGSHNERTFGASTSRVRNRSQLGTCSAAIAGTTLRTASARKIDRIGNRAIIDAPPLVQFAEDTPATTQRLAQDYKPLRLQDHPATRARRDSSIQLPSGSKIIDIRATLLSVIGAKPSRTPLLRISSCTASISAICRVM